MSGYYPLDWGAEGGRGLAELGGEEGVKGQRPLSLQPEKPRYAHFNFASESYEAQRVKTCTQKLWG